VSEAELTIDRLNELEARLLEARAALVEAQRYQEFLFNKQMGGAR